MKLNILLLCMLRVFLFSTSPPSISTPTSTSEEQEQDSKLPSNTKELQESITVEINQRVLRIQNCLSEMDIKRLEFDRAPKGEGGEQEQYLAAIRILQELQALKAKKLQEQIGLLGFEKQNWQYLTAEQLKDHQLRQEQYNLDQDSWGLYCCIS